MPSTVEAGTASLRGRREDLIAHAYAKLRELIVLGRLAPGARVVESTVAERLGVSRTPVRSALQRLQQEGYIVGSETARRAQLAVAPLTQDDGRELFWIVGELEGFAAHLAAELPEAERGEIVHQLRAINDELRAESHAAHPDAHRIFDLHTRFHQSYVDAASGPRLSALQAAIKPQAERYRRLYSSVLGGAIEESLAEHDVLIGHLAAGDAEAAARAARENWRNAAARLSRAIDVVGERGGW
jgi:DNA-binding GntR family transcriptional regulator